MSTRDWWLVRLVAADLGTDDLPSLAECAVFLAGIVVLLLVWG